MGKKIVIKIGTGVLAQESGKLRYAMIARLAESIAKLNEAGHQCIVVSSGAVGAGIGALDLDARPEEIEMLQACAAAGQARLVQLYETQFQQLGFQVAQILLTHEDLEDERRLANVLATLNSLLQFPTVIPVINENDSVAVYELKVGDNDKLSAIVARLLRADQFLLLTTVPGLRGPGASSEEDIIPEVTNVDEILHFATDEKGAHSTGGMKSKLEAVKEAVDAGIETIIASGSNPEQLPALVAGGGTGTRFRIPS